MFPITIRNKVRKRKYFLKYFIVGSKKKIILKVNPSRLLLGNSILWACVLYFLGQWSGKLEERLYLDWPFI